MRTGNALSRPRTGNIEFHRHTENPTLTINFRWNAGSLSPGLFRAWAQVRGPQDVSTGQFRSAAVCPGTSVCWPSLADQPNAPEAPRWRNQCSGHGTLANEVDHLRILQADDNRCDR